MNFAEKLRDWRNSESTIQECESFIRILVDSKFKSIVTNIENGTEKGKIGITIFDKNEFSSGIVENSKIKYNKNVKQEIIENLLISALRTNKNIFVEEDPLNKNIIFIFYKNDTEITSDTITNMIENWFSSIVLPDFEKRYRAWHTSNISLSSTYMYEYSYSPFVEFSYRTRYVTKAEIIKKITELVETNGLKCRTYPYAKTFRLYI